MPNVLNNIKIDEIVRSAGHATPQTSPEQMPSDDFSPGRNLHDKLMNTADYHNKKATRKYKDLEFVGLILRVRTLANRKQLENRTSPVFSNYILETSENNDQKIYELFVHIPEVSGILPQPSFVNIVDYKNSRLGEFDKRKYEMITSRFPRFYCTGKTQPGIFDMWKVSYPDENFLYFGRANKLHKNASAVFAVELEKIQKYNSLQNNSDAELVIPADYPAGGMIS